MGAFQRWTILPDGTPRYPCTVDVDTWLLGDTISVTGDWWVDCEDGFVISDSKKVYFNSGNVVFDGDIDLRSFGELWINSAPSSDHIVFVRGTPAANGDLLKGAQTIISMEQTFVLLQYGVVDMGGGAKPLTWTAPLAGNFEDLALWSESPLQHEIGGQSNNELTGTFFTPLSDPFKLTGQGGQFQTDAQFITRRLEIGGQGEVLMHPDPDRSTPIPIREVRLIR
jgi:hypothetical protein